jgi:four helix bundle protein
MSNIEQSFNLEDRLIDFACLCLELCDLLPNTKAGNNLEYQLSKTGTACTLVYGEAPAAELSADFLHKMKIVLKEIRESRVNLKIIRPKPIINHSKIDEALNEVSQLMAILLKRIETARSTNLLKQNK